MLPLAGRVIPPGRATAGATEEYPRSGGDGGAPEPEIRYADAMDGERATGLDREGAASGIEMPAGCALLAAAWVREEEGTGGI
jgi:hypothetical protein